MKKRVVLIGDTHLGGNGTIMPEEIWFKPTGENVERPYQCSPLQKILLNQPDAGWYALCDEYKRPDLLVLNGDLADGSNKKQHGLGMWTTDIHVQCEAMAALIDMLKPRNVIGTTGSGYHVGGNPNYDKMVCDKVGGEFKGGFASIKIGDNRFYFQHKTGTSSSTWQYRTTPIAKALVLAALSEPEYGHYDLVCKSHAHYFCYAGFSSSLSMILPCWKIDDPFLGANVEFHNPALGFVTMEVTDHEYSWQPHIFHVKQADHNPDVVIA